MLIIFDLDDTLIDTSGSLTPIKIGQALDQMIAAGLPVNREVALPQLLELDRLTMSASETLTVFLKSYGTKFLEIGLGTLYQDLPFDCEVLPRKGVNGILSQLQKSHDLALVTIGNDEFQRAKMEKAGIDCSLFCKIVISQDRNKGNYYQQITKEQGYSSEQVIVCGDRVILDLLPARKLGYATVQMKYGRGAVNQDTSFVDYTIYELDELEDILKNF